MHICPCCWCCAHHSWCTLMHICPAVDAVHIRVGVHVVSFLISLNLVYWGWLWLDGLWWLGKGGLLHGDTQDSFIALQSLRIALPGLSSSLRLVIVTKSYNALLLCPHFPGCVGCCDLRAGVGGFLLCSWRAGDWSWLLDSLTVVLTLFSLYSWHILENCVWRILVQNCAKCGILPRVHPVLRQRERLMGASLQVCLGSDEALPLAHLVAYV